MQPRVPQPRFLSPEPGRPLCAQLLSPLWPPVNFSTGFLRGGKGSVRGKGRWNHPRPSDEMDTQRCKLEQAQRRQKQKLVGGELGSPLGGSSSILEALQMCILTPKQPQCKSNHFSILRTQVAALPFQMQLPFLFGESLREQQMPHKGLS